MVLVKPLGLVFFSTGIFVLYFQHMHTHVCAGTQTVFPYIRQLVMLSYYAMISIVEDVLSHWESWVKEQRVSEFSHIELYFNLSSVMNYVGY